MNNKEAIETLELFNYQAMRLKNSRLYHQIKERRLVSIQVITKEDRTVHTIFHDEDAINAFILPLRFLIQDNERCSLHNLAILYDKIPVPINVKEEYHLYRKKLNEYLDEETTLLLPEEELSRRKIL